MFQCNLPSQPKTGVNEASKFHDQFGFTPSLINQCSCQQSRVQAEIVPMSTNPIVPMHISTCDILLGLIILLIECLLSLLSSFACCVSLWLYLRPVLKSEIPCSIYFKKKKRHLMKRTLTVDRPHSRIAVPSPTNNLARKHEQLAIATPCYTVIL